MIVKMRHFGDGQVRKVHLQAKLSQIEHCIGQKNQEQNTDIHTVQDIHDEKSRSFHWVLGGTVYIC